MTNQAVAQVWNQSKRRAWEQANNQVNIHGRAWRQTWHQVRWPVNNQVEEQTWRQIRDQIRRQW